MYHRELNLAHLGRKRDHHLGSLACSDFMAGKCIDVEGLGYRRAHVGDQFVDSWKLFGHIALGILLTFPKAQRKNPVRFGIGYKDNPVHEPRLAFNDWEDLFLKGLGEFSRFSWHGPDGDDSTEHGVPPFGRCMVRKSLCPTGY